MIVPPGSLTLAFIGIPGPMELAIIIVVVLIIVVVIRAISPRRPPYE